MELGDTGSVIMAAGPGRLSPVRHDDSGWASGIWGLVAVLVIVTLVAILVISVRRGSSTDDED
ncbi:hypothetical protein ABZZ36_35655 [Actinacidiphila glaucinigra]|uniref:hypothetical protein n=1 Tax=Actinacidiphila glaucinigra TaxID=235986 RepID=UPI0033AD0256